MINFRENWRGYLWQGRFSSYPMELDYLLNAAAYVELNPVKAKTRKELLMHKKLLEICGDWKTYSMQSQPTSDKILESHLNTGRPLGSVDFIKRTEQLI